VRVETLVLDGDDRVLDRRRDVLAVDEDAILLAGQGGQLAPVSVQEHRVVGVLELVAGLQ